MLKRAAAVVMTGLMVATISVADDGKQNRVGAGTASNIDPGSRSGMMGRSMPPKAGARNRAMMPATRGRPQPGPFAGVEFSEKQRKQIQEMMAKERSVNQERQRKIMQVQQSIQKLYSADLWDVDAISKAYDALFAEQKITVAAMVKSRNQIYKILTGKQKAQLKTAQVAQQKRRQQMRQKRLEQMKKQQQPTKK